MKIELSHKRLMLFIALSLSLHLVWLTGQTNYQIYMPAQQDSQIAVRLRQATPPKIHNRPPSPPEKMRDKQASLQRNIKQKPARQESTQNQLNSAQVLTMIRQKLTQHFVYPVMARRMGWQGRVLLGFQLDHGGSIQKVHIKKSSGYAILDNSAMVALNKIGKITLQASDILNGNWQLEIPIIYRLEG